MLQSRSGGVRSDPQLVVHRGALRQPACDATPVDVDLPGELVARVSVIHSIRAADHRHQAAQSPGLGACLAKCRCRPVAKADRELNNLLPLLR